MMSRSFIKEYKDVIIKSSVHCTELLICRQFLQKEEDILLIRTISIDYGLNLFHKSIIVSLVIDSTEHRIAYDITISVD